MVRLTSWSPSRYQMQGAEERRMRCINHTPQGGANKGNAAAGALMVDQGHPGRFLFQWPHDILKPCQRLCSDRN